MKNIDIIKTAHLMKFAASYGGAPQQLSPLQEHSWGQRAMQGAAQGAKAVLNPVGFGVNAARSFMQRAPQQLSPLQEQERRVQRLGISGTASHLGQYYRERQKLRDMRTEAGIPQSNRFGGRR